MLSLLLLPPEGEDFPRSSPAPGWGVSHRTLSFVNCSSVGPSHRLQFFTNFPSMGPFHGVQSFRNRLLQCGSPMGSQVLPASPLQGALLCPRVYRSYQGPAPSQTFHGFTASFGHPPVSAWGPPRASDGYLLHCGPPWAAGDSLSHHGLLHRLQGNLCSGAWSTSSPLLLH